MELRSEAVSRELAMSKVMQMKRITNGGLGAEPQQLRDFS